VHYEVYVLRDKVLVLLLSLGKETDRLAIEYLDLPYDLDTINRGVINRSFSFKDAFRQLTKGKDTENTYR